MDGILIGRVTDGSLGRPVVRGPVQGGRKGIRDDSTETEYLPIKLRAVMELKIKLGSGEDRKPKVSLKQLQI